MKGIDVSKYQGSIDWQKVKAAGIEFAFVRVGWAGYEGGIDEGLDATFAANMAGAIAAGIPVGVYVYSYCKTEAAARRAAREAVALCAPYRLTMPLVLDLEDSTTYTPLGRAATTAIAAAFLDEAEKTGYYAMLYSYKSFVAELLDMGKLAKYDFWLAHYTAKTDYTGPYGIWQYSSSGTVDGIRGRVDLNLAYKDYPAIIGGRELGETVAPIPVRMTCAATGADRVQMCDALDDLGIGHTVDGNTIITDVEVSAGDQRRLTADAAGLGIRWEVYTDAPAEDKPAEDDNKAVSGLLTDEPEDKPANDDMLDIRDLLDGLRATVEAQQEMIAALRVKVNILARRANIEEV